MPPTLDVLQIDMETILPNTDDYQKLSSNLATLVGRVLVKYVPALSVISGLTKEHIPHHHCKEMTKPSRVVCLLLQV